MLLVLSDSGSLYIRNHFTKTKMLSNQKNKDINLKFEYRIFWLTRRSGLVDAP